MYRFYVLQIIYVIVHPNSLVCRCAKAAQAAGHRMFGIQFYGECWSGENSQLTFHKDGPSDNCIEDLGNPPPPCDMGTNNACVGGPFANYVYTIREGKNI